MCKNSNTPAFPTITWEQLETGQIVQVIDEYGLSKREVIAAMALQGLMSCNDKGEFNSIEDSCAEAAHFAVKAADALLAELSK